MHKILDSYKEVQKWSHKQNGQKGSIFEPRKILHNKRPYAHRYAIDPIVARIDSKTENALFSETTFHA